MNRPLSQVLAGIAVDLNSMDPDVVPGSVATTTQIDLAQTLRDEGFRAGVLASARAIDACCGHHDPKDERAVGRHEAYGLAEQAVLALLRPAPTSKRSAL